MCDELEIGLQFLPSGDIATGGKLPNNAKSTLYKTEYCKRWIETGSCRYSTRCQFAHCETELRCILRHPKYKTAKCQNFLISGKCPYGNRCRFLHDERVNQEGGKDGEIRNNYSGDADTPVTLLPKKTTIVNEGKYKTQLCRTWSRTRNCPYGPRCQFLHGYNDPLSQSKTVQPPLNISPEVDSIRESKLWHLFGKLGLGKDQPIDSIDWSVAKSTTYSSSTSPNSSRGSTTSGTSSSETSSILWDTTKDINDSPRSAREESESYNLSGTRDKEDFWSEIRPNFLFQEEQHTGPTESDPTIEDCAICFSSGADSIIVLCGHQFHRYCAMRWLNKNMSCPICRAPAQDIQPIWRRTPPKVDSISPFLTPHSGNTADSDSVTDDNLASLSTQTPSINKLSTHYWV